MYVQSNQQQDGTMDEERGTEAVRGDEVMAEAWKMEERDLRLVREVLPDEQDEQSVARPCYKYSPRVPGVGKVRG